MDIPDRDSRLQSLRRYLADAEVEVERRIRRDEEPPDPRLATTVTVTSELPTQNNAVSDSGDGNECSATIANSPASEPFHIESSQVPCQKLPTKTLYFQDNWYKQFPWLHFDTE